MSEPLLRTPLYSWHAAHGARIVPFGGWEMPVQYTSIVDEHVATRTAAGLFDISHMGRLVFTGTGAAPFLERLLTASVLTLKPGQIRYSLMLDESGGILDDVLVYCTPASGATEHMLVVNASNRLKILDWIGTHRSASDEVEVVDRTFDWGMFAVQGPRALPLVERLLGRESGATRLAAMKYYSFDGGVWPTSSPSNDGWYIVSRTGYSGEDGVELIMPSGRLVEWWERTIEEGKSAGARACGLGARDTLRLEAAMPLYGHELNEQTDPFMANLDFAVKMDKGDFMGKRALVQAQKARDARLSRVRVGLELEGKRIAREGHLVLRDDAKVGVVTSGTFSPTLAKSIAMAYVQPDVSQPGTALTVDIRGQGVAARVVKLPFYKRRKE